LLHIVDCVPLAVGMLDYSCYLFWVDCVPHIVEIGFVALKPFRKRHWEVVCHSILASHLIVECFYANFVIGGWVDESNIVHFEQLFSSLENHLQMVFRQHLIWRHIVLAICYKYMLRINSSFILLYSKNITYRFYSRYWNQSLFEESLL
jgi:hypothetical protein